MPLIRKLLPSATTKRGRAWCRIALLGLIVVRLAGSAMCHGADPSEPAAGASLQTRLEARVAHAPEDASAWRMLGRIYLTTEREAAAFEAFQRAVTLAPDNVAANYDFGRVLFIAGRTQDAATYLRRVIETAPEGDYAEQSRDLLSQISTDAADGPILQAGYEVKRFDGSDEAERNFEEVTDEPDEERRFRVRLETGLLYNSNVALAPISRQLAPGTRESFQAFVNPDVEYRWFRNETWTAGPTFAGYFNLNEGNFRQFNLQNYTPGFFIQRAWEFDQFTLEPRLQYDYTHDEFEGQTYGNRHALTVSASALWNDGDVTFAYWTTNYTNFANDGVLPQFDSRDGWTNAGGLSHTVDTGIRYLDYCRAGIDVEAVDTQGTDYRFAGFYLYGQTESELRPDLWLTLQWGWGHRDYYDFSLSPSRNENIWRLGTELSQKLTENWTVALVFNYDRFDSRNDAFASSRSIGGIVARFQY